MYCSDLQFCLECIDQIIPGNAGHHTWSDRKPAGVHYGALGEDAGAQWLSFPPVVAGGSRANCLHYIANNKTLK